MTPVESDDKVEEVATLHQTGARGRCQPPFRWSLNSERTAGVEGFDYMS